MKRLLFISHCVPYPPDKGERIRAFHEIRALSRNFHITLAALGNRRSDAAIAECLKAFCEEVILAPSGGKTGLLRGAASLFTGRSVTEGFFYNSQLLRRLKHWCPWERFDLVLGYSSAVLRYVLATPARARVMDLVDVDSLKWRSYADRAGPLRSWVYRHESRGVAQLERRAIDSCDAVIFASHAEAGAVPLHNARVSVVPNGVDAEYFRPSRSAADSPLSLVFVGTMNYRPNAEAVCWFVANVWEVLKRRFPNLVFKIVGRNPTRAVRRLTTFPGVVVTGEVPDVRPYLSSTRVAVAPLQMARGVQNKVLEAMGMARPVVGSPAALEGLDVTECAGVFRADTTAQWQEILSRLLTDPQRCGSLGEEARQHVRSRYTWESCMKPLRSVCGRLTQAAPPLQPEVGRVARRRLE